MLARSRAGTGRGHSRTQQSASTQHRVAKRSLLRKADLSAQILNTQYAVRGAVVLRANELEKQLLDPVEKKKLKFSRVTYCNIGNPQELGQPAVSFFRQVLSLVENPALIPHAAKVGILEDAAKRAQALLASMPGGTTGAYTGSQGLESVRENVAAFIASRDGHLDKGKAYCSPANIFLSDGASPSVQRSLQLLIRGHGHKDGVMVPIPQYPLYSATIANLGGEQVNYYLNEDKNWSLDIDELDRAHTDSVRKGVKPRGLVIINPGNPTGQCLPRKNMEGIVDFAHRKGLVLLADEVYQENVYIKDKRPFNSFKKVKHELGPQYQNLELLSFHSVSKGIVGECGKRGGYVEMDGIDPEVKEQYYKLASINLCPNVQGQAMVDLMVSPPKPGDPSYALYAYERDDLYSSLKRRAQLVTSFLNALEGVRCNSAEGAMYAFPQISIPAKAVALAKAQNMAPDLFYSLQLLNETGVCLVPGSGFGQREGTFHFRTTFLPREDLLLQVLDSVKTFHAQFLKQYA